MAKHKEHREADVDNDKCPECGGELDTGWECNKCGHDAMPDVVFTHCNVCGRPLGQDDFQGMCLGCAIE